MIRKHGVHIVVVRSGPARMHVDYSEARRASLFKFRLYTLEDPKDTQIAADLAEVMYLQGAKDALFQFLHDRE